ncbi:unnamed protein product [Microthlaspi erraticum]|uniref:Uncharacterized protein n=1 Tax=Microthlaspi erraticum TaxID=1685480 RepID=A0A6D2J4U5_9BRAS|nr:unnamed protein product [Microthlaspi erraticum]
MLTYMKQRKKIQFHTGISRGLSSVDLRYKAANSSANVSGSTGTLLTVKRRGEAEVLNGEQILDDIEKTLLGNQSLEYDPYIGVRKRRKYSVGLEEKPKIMASLVFHHVAA